MLPFTLILLKNLSSEADLKRRKNESAMLLLIIKVIDDWWSGMLH
jgi:hypothetical protein